MDSVGDKNNVPRNTDEPAPPGTEIPLPLEKPKTPVSTPHIPKVLSSAKGVENAKKRLRAFSIQKKTPITPIVVLKPTGSGNTTVLIGKLSGVKITPKVEDPEQKKLQKPPKPGTARKSIQDSYTDLQKRTLSEIEDMKRKMELVELGIPLGLICPTSTSEKAMPTKAMPPIKSFLDPAKVDDLIREAKKAKQEGKEFKFDYHKLLPDYDNPFQRKKDESSHDKDKDRKSDRRKSETEKDRRKSDKYDSRRHDYRKDEKYRERDKEKSKDKSRCKEDKKDDESRKTDKTVDKETDVNLNDYLVCDSWSLDNDEKNSSSSPKVQQKNSNFAATFTPSADIKVTEPSEQLKASLSKKKEMLRNCALETPLKTPVKIEKLQPVIDSFKFEIDPNDDEILDIFDEDSGLEKYAQQRKSKKQCGLYGSPDKSIDYGTDISKDTSLDGLNDDTFLESVINEIKQEDLSDEGSQDKGLVEYEISPSREDESPRKIKRGSVTPEIVDKVRTQSQRSDYSEGYRSSDSYTTTDTNESGYKSVDSYRISVEKELDEALEAEMSKSTVDSLETWSFVLKICQPLLFRHDKNKCYKETRTAPKIWFTENPKRCACVKDRSVVYKELEMCKMYLVDRVYGCDQIADFPCPNVRGWYPRNSLCPNENNLVTSNNLSNEWEAEDSLQAHRAEDRRSETPQRNNELSLDREYQRFMEAVWPDVVDSKIESSRSTTPVRQESRKKKKDDLEKDQDDKKSKKIKLSSEGWSQESDLEEEQDKSKTKILKEKAKSRKRKHSSSTLSSSLSDSDEDSDRKRKIIKKKAIKKTKSKSAKRRRIGRKLLKKLKEKQIKRSKHNKDSDDDSDKKKDKKAKKKKQERLKKRAQKKKRAKVQTSSSSSSSSDSSSDSESVTSDSDRRSKKAKKRSQERKKKVKKQRKPSTSDSTQSEDLFDVNILNNIKTERLTDDEKGQKLMEFSPRRQKPREIIDVKELQNDFVENIHIKIEADDVPKEVHKEDTKQNNDLDKEPCVEVNTEEIKLPEDPPEDILPSEAPPPLPVAPPPPAPEESNMSQCSSQESMCSVKDVPSYEKDESHLRPSSQNSNYSFNDVISASQNVLYQKGIETVTECEEKYPENYETANYEMYEQLAMAYQSDVASQRGWAPGEEVGGELGGEAGGETGGEAGAASRRIETVVRARCGEIKCDWRAGQPAAPPARAQRPSRWGLKPGEVNIVLTGEGTHFASEQTQQPVYQIQSLANRTDVNTGYDEAYMDMYGASDRLQYGDCFAPDFNTDTMPPGSSVNIAVTLQAAPHAPHAPHAPLAPLTPHADTRTSSLDDRINQALRETVLGEVAKEVETIDTERDAPEKGILITSISSEPRGSKRVSFADGYKPGQDSDVEEPPVKKRKKARRVGCAWPCPAAHPDHVPLWDALPPPPPPPGSPPPPARAAPPARLLRAPPAHPALPVPPTRVRKFDQSIPLPGFMVPEPPPGLLTLH